MDAPIQERDPKQKTVYFAAALFCLRECGLNAILNDKLEKKGYNSNLPQRDGFEFSQFTEELFGEFFVNEKQRSQAISWIIYLLDLGKFLWEADVIVANLDEPIDPGVIVEVMFAHQMKKPVVGYRTESRSPYGTLTDFSNGMHFFLLFPCDSFLVIPQSSISSGSDLEIYSDQIAEDLHKAIGDAEKRFGEKKFNKELTFEAQKIVDLAHALFHDIKDLHEKESVRTILQRYVAIKDQLEAFEPIKMAGQKIHKA